MTIYSCMYTHVYIEREMDSDMKHSFKYILVTHLFMCVTWWFTCSFRLREIWIVFVFTCGTGLFIFLTWSLITFIYHITFWPNVCTCKEGENVHITIYTFTHLYWQRDGLLDITYSFICIIVTHSFVRVVWFFMYISDMPHSLIQSYVTILFLTHDTVWFIRERWHIFAFLYDVSISLILERQGLLTHSCVWWDSITRDTWYSFTFLYYIKMYLHFPSYIKKESSYSFLFLHVYTHVYSEEDKIRDMTHPFKRIFWTDSFIYVTWCYIFDMMFDIYVYFPLWHVYWLILMWGRCLSYMWVRRVTTNHLYLFNHSNV